MKKILVKKILVVFFIFCLNSITIAAENCEFPLDDNSELINNNQQNQQKNFDFNWYRDWIEKISNITKVDEPISILVNHLKAGGFSLEDFEINEEKLQEWIEAGNTARAKNDWEMIKVINKELPRISLIKKLTELIRIKSTSSRVDKLVDILNQELLLTGLSPEKVGTSEKELQILISNGYLVQSSNYLEMMKNNFPEVDTDYHMKKIKYFLNKGGWKICDLVAYIKNKKTS